MIKLHREKSDRYADKVEEKFDDLVLNYNTVIYGGDEKDPSEAIHRLPYIEETDKNFVGREAIEEFISQVDDQLHRERSISGDSCYIDPRTGEAC